MFSVRTSSMALSLAVSSIAFGHGVQIQVTRNAATGKIETRQVVYTGSRPGVISDVTRVYVMPLLFTETNSGTGWYTRPLDQGVDPAAPPRPLHPSGPGLTYQYDDQLPGTGWSWTGTGGLPALGGTNFGYDLRDGLKAWNGSAFVDPGAEQFQLFRGDGTAAFTGSTVNAITTDSAPFPSMTLSTIAASTGSNSQSSNAHSSVSFRLLGDGVSSTVPADDGIYLATMRFTSTAAGVNPSDDFYFVMHKNVNADVATGVALQLASSLGIPAAQVQVVPEPAAFGFVVGALSLLRRRR